MHVFLWFCRIMGDWGGMCKLNFRSLSVFRWIFHFQMPLKSFLHIQYSHSRYLTYCSGSALSSARWIILVHRVYVPLSHKKDYVGYIYPPIELESKSSLEISEFSFVFRWIFQLQMPLKIFLHIQYPHSRYLTCCPRSALSNARWIRFIH